jgi:hypothetical protein
MPSSQLFNHSYSRQAPESRAKLALQPSAIPESRPGTPTGDRMKARATSVVHNPGSSTAVTNTSSKPKSAPATSQLSDSRRNGNLSVKSSKSVPKPAKLSEYEIKRNKNIERSKLLMAEALEARGHLDASLPAPRPKPKPRKKAEHVPPEERRRGRSKNKDS